MKIKLRLWSIQEEYKLDEIASEGKLACYENKFSKFWDMEYQWMANQMNRRIGKPELENQYPIWAWYQSYNAKKCRPDLRKTAHLPSGTNGIRIEFEKEKNEVLLSDFNLWHYPLSYKSIIAKNEDEYIKFELKLKELKLEKVNFKDLPKQIQNEIMKSWDRIFDMNFENEYFTSKRDEKMIQACCWEINEDEIVKIDKFIAK